MTKKFEIRNSTAEFLTFVAANKEDGVQVVYKDETIWATQAAMGELFGCSSDNIGVHLKNIYTEGELLEAATTEKISVVQLEGSRNVNREPTFYNLDAIISVGYRVENPVEIDPRIPVETDPLFFFQLAPRIAKFSCRTESFCRVTKQPFSAIS